MSSKISAFQISTQKSNVVHPYLCCTGKRVSAGGPMRGRGSAGRLAMRRGGRHRGGPPGRGGALSRGVARGGVVRGKGDRGLFFNHLSVQKRIVLFS